MDTKIFADKRVFVYIDREDKKNMSILVQDVSMFIVVLFELGVRDTGFATIIGDAIHGFDIQVTVLHIVGLM